MQNPFTALQDNLAQLLAAHPYFAGAPILTEKLADLDAQISNKILQVGGFGIVITTARGERHGAPDNTQLLPLVLLEELTVTIIHSPLLDEQHTALDAVAAAIAAVSGKPSRDDNTGDPDEDFVWRVLGHEYRENAAGGVVTHFMRVNTYCLF